MPFTNTAPDLAAISPAISGPTVQTVLVLTSQPGVSALLCGYVSLSGHMTAVPLDDETIGEAVLRVHPRVAIIDVDHPAATSARIARQLGIAGTHTVLCSLSDRTAEARRRAQSTGALYFSLPIRHEDFDLMLRTAILL